VFTLVSPVKSLPASPFGKSLSSGIQFKGNAESYPENLTGKTVGWGSKREVRELRQQLESEFNVPFETQRFNVLADNFFTDPDGLHHRGIKIQHPRPIPFHAGFHLHNQWLPARCFNVVG
jgi:hypothetical protein